MNNGLGQMMNESDQFFEFIEFINMIHSNDGLDIIGDGGIRWLGHWIRCHFCLFLCSDLVIVLTG